MQFFNLCKLDISKSHSQRIKSYMPVHLSNMPDKNKDLPKYILIGTCGFSINANLTFPKAIVNRSRATCPSIFPTCLIKTKICQSTSLLAHAIFQSMQTCISECHSQWNMPDKNKVLPEYILIGTCGFSIYANMTLPKVIVNRSRATCLSIFPTCLIKSTICQSTSLLTHAVFQSMQIWPFQKTTLTYQLLHLEHDLLQPVPFQKPMSTDQQLHLEPDLLNPKPLTSCNN